MPLKSYPRYITPGFRPFDPVELARETERMVCRGDERKYTRFYAAGVYGGIATGYTCGCCLRCVFCWVDWSRDFPERHGRFYSGEEAFERLEDAAHRYGVRKLRISGAEPTLGKRHLLSLLGRVEESEFSLFVLETNGILFGVDRDYVKAIAGFKKPHVRVSLKAGTPEAFTRKTGARPESFELPFRGILNLMDLGVSFHVAAMSADPRIMARGERISLIERLMEIDPMLVWRLGEEVVDPYRTTLARLKHAGLELEWPLKEVYPPIRPPKRGEFLRTRRGKYSQRGW
ncbi:MAG: radical SAM protein [Candidatus Bathyarchaeia archaeon]